MIPITLQELIEASNQPMDPYHRELMKWAALRIIELEKRLPIPAGAKQ